MGTTHSTLNELSTEEITNFVNNLGDKYKAYGDAIASNAVDGDLLMEIDDPAEFKETLQCLDITNLLHQKKLTAEWRKARATFNLLSSSSEGGKTFTTTATTADSGNDPPTKVLTNVNHGMMDSDRSSSPPCDASEITLDTALSTSRRTSYDSSNTANSSSSSQQDLPYCRPILEDSAEEAASPEPAQQQPPLPSISWDQRRFIEQLELPKSLAPEDPALEPYFEIASKTMVDLNASLAMVNLLHVKDIESSSDDDVVEDRGYNNLSSANKAAPDAPQRIHLDDGGYEGVCRKFILGSDEDFCIDELPKDVAAVFGFNKYYGNIIKFGNLRIGTVCILVDETPGGTGSETSLQQKKEVLKVMADLVKCQLEKRAALLQRKRNLKEDLRLIKESGADPVLAAANGPMRAVTASQVAQRQTMFPYPNEARCYPNGSPTMSQFNRRSSGLPAFLDQATEAERAHLPHNYCGDPAFGKSLDLINTSFTAEARINVEEYVKSKVLVYRRDGHQIRTIIQ